MEGRVGHLKWHTCEHKTQNFEKRHAIDWTKRDGVKIKDPVNECAIGMRVYVPTKAIIVNRSGDVLYNREVMSIQHSALSHEF